MSTTAATAIRPAWPRARREISRRSRDLPAATPAPRLRWDGQIAGWIVLIFDDIDGRHPALAPGSPDAGRVVAMTAGLAASQFMVYLAARPDGVGAVSTAGRGTRQMLKEALKVDLGTGIELQNHHAG